LVRFSKGQKWHMAVELPSMGGVNHKADTDGNDFAATKHPAITLQRKKKDTRR
jgi:hypothetical protein